MKIKNMYIEKVTIAYEVSIGNTTANDVVKLVIKYHNYMLLW